MAVPRALGRPVQGGPERPGAHRGEAAVARRLAQGQGVVDLKTYLSESNLVAAKISRAPACHGTETSRGQPAPAGKKRKAPAAAAVAGGVGPSGEVLRSQLEAKERALAQAKGQISRLEEELGKAKKRELAEARQALCSRGSSGPMCSRLKAAKAQGAQASPWRPVIRTVRRGCST
ncbi:uncharacterized protein LOC133920588 [Phragmites australis]|uniref:uncharacterized protein LOC133920588 n=1 Tax=Phragmites australis TaxID=29695 RepID=UPI002D77A323|nr:uncharacterized protein LOC133920588 [Phragmites australis]